MRNNLWMEQCICRHKVIRVFPKTAEQVDVLRTLEDDFHVGVPTDLFLCRIISTGCVTF